MFPVTWDELMLADQLCRVIEAGYSNGEQAEACEAHGILPHVPANKLAAALSYGVPAVLTRSEQLSEPGTPFFANRKITFRNSLGFARAFSYQGRKMITG